jgi:hypothetical protein
MKDIKTVSFLFGLLTTTAIVPLTTYGATAEPSESRHSATGNRVFSYNDPASKDIKEIALIFNNHRKYLESAGHDFINSLATSSPLQGFDDITFQGYLNHLVTKGTEELQKKGAGEKITNAWENYGNRFIVIFKSTFALFNTCIDRAKEIQSMPQGDYLDEREDVVEGRISVEFHSNIKGHQRTLISALKRAWDAFNDILGAHQFFKQPVRGQDWSILAFISNCAKIDMSTPSKGLWGPTRPAFVSLFNAYAEGRIDPELETAASKSLLSDPDTPTEDVHPKTFETMIEAGAGSGGASASAGSSTSRPAPIVIPFSSEDLRTLETVNTAQEVVSSSQAAGLDPSRNDIRVEGIQSYGEKFYKDHGLGVRNLFNKTLPHLGFAVSTLDNAASETILSLPSRGFHTISLETTQETVGKLTDWIYGLSLEGLDKSTIIKAIKYMAGTIANPGKPVDPHHAMLLKTLVDTHSLDTALKSKLFGTPSYSDWQGTLFGVLTHIQEHDGKCAAGAKGRAILSQLTILNFLKDIK